MHGCFPELGLVKILTICAELMYCVVTVIKLNWNSQKQAGS